MIRLSDLLLMLSAFSFIIVIGGAVYEHLAVVPQWTAAPPASLAMVQGPYGLKGEAFWMMVHPITLLLMIGALAANWRSARRTRIGLTLGSYALVLVLTAIWFVPQLIEMLTAPYSDTVDPAFQVRAAHWELLSLVRLACMMAMALVLLSALVLPAGSADTPGERGGSREL